MTIQTHAGVSRFSDLRTLTSSSTSEPHVLQVPHFPTHLIDSAPQFEHTNTVVEPEDFEESDLRFVPEERELSENEEVFAERRKFDVST